MYAIDIYIVLMLENKLRWYCTAVSISGSVWSSVLHEGEGLWWIAEPSGMYIDDHEP